VKSRTIPREQVLHAQSSISSVRANLIGVILNGVDVRTNGYYDYGRYRSTASQIVSDKISLESDSQGALTQSN